MASPQPPKNPRRAEDLWSDYAEPTDGVERRLAAIWSDALGVEPVGVDDNFFELGGHSILAAELLATLQRDFGVELEARALFQWPTIAALATGLEPYLDVPYAFFGHCGSALAAYEASAEMIRAGLPAPARLYVSSQVAPQDGPTGRFLQMSDAELAAELEKLIRELGGVP